MLPQVLQNFQHDLCYAPPSFFRLATEKGSKKRFPVKQTTSSWLMPTALSI